MNRGIYPMLSGALAQEHRLQTIAHNTANVNTVGFKKEAGVFSSLIARVGVSATTLRPGPTLLGNAAPLRPVSIPAVFARVRPNQTDFSRGSLRKTDNPLHLAITSEGFFELKTPEGVQFTRNGRFRLDSKRRLINQEGFPVMGTKGELKLPAGKVNIGGDGSVDVSGRKVGTIKVVMFEALSTLRKTGASRFVGEDPKPVNTPTVSVGHVEESNVNVMEEMVNLIEVTRVYESAQKIIQTMDRLTDVAIQDVGKTG